MKARGVKEPAQLVSKADRIGVLMNNNLAGESAGPKDSAKRNFSAGKVTKYGEKTKFMHYSREMDKLFCLSCSFFGSSKPQSKELCFRFF